MKKIIYIVFIFLYTSTVFGQQLIERSQYFQNLGQFNPAFAGTHDKVNANLSVRKQWLGFEDAPFSQSLSFQLRLNKGLGFSIIASNETWGLSKISGANLGLNYILKANDNLNVSFGINSSLNQFGINRSRIVTENPTDLAVYNGIENQLFLNFGASVFVSSDQYFLGISSDNLLESKNNINAQYVSESSLNRIFYLTGGTKVKFNEYIYLSPSFLFSKTKNAPGQIQADGKLIFNSKFWVNAGYRVNDAVILGAGFVIGSIKLGYSFDITTSSLNSSLGNTHEVSISFSKTKKNFDWYSRPRKKRRL